MDTIPHYAAKQVFTTK